MSKNPCADPFFLGLLLHKGPTYANSLLQYFFEPALPKTMPQTPFSLPAYSEPFQTRLARIHPTWLHEDLAALSPFENRILEEHRKSDSHWIGTRFKKKIEEKIWLHLTEARPELVPFNLCRPDVMTPLTQIPIEQYESAWFILGLRDLASSFKKIIDASIIRLIQSSLNTKEQEVLKIYSQEKEVVTFPKMNLHPDLSTKELRDMIFERGINRMSKGF